MNKEKSIWTKNLNLVFVYVFIFLVGILIVMIMASYLNNKVKEFTGDSVAITTNK